MKQGTDYILRISLNSFDGKVASELDFSIEFYVFPNRRVRFTKSELIRVQRGGETNYYALVHSSDLDNGRLRVRLEVNSDVSNVRVGNRIEVMEGDTSIIIGTDSMLGVCERLVSVLQGYAIGCTVAMVSDIPQDEEKELFFGIIRSDILRFDLIPEGALNASDLLSVKGSDVLNERISFGLLSQGDKMVVLIPESSYYSVKKDDGLGGRVVFDTTYQGSNGECVLKWGDTYYRVYGEMATAGGEAFFYIEIE